MYWHVLIEYELHNIILNARCPLILNLDLSLFNCDSKSVELFFEYIYGEKFPEKNVPLNTLVDVWVMKQTNKKLLFKIWIVTVNTSQFLS